MLMVDDLLFSGYFVQLTSNLKIDIDNMLQAVQRG
jgi:hypothetical protein